MKQLVFRMSSLGDLILSTAFLENLPEGIELDWVISSDFEFVLKGHPKIKRLIVFDKKTGIRGWIELLRLLALENYQKRIDLHGTIRTAVARLYFLGSDLLRGRSVAWTGISKQRARMIAYFALKQALPKNFRPSPIWQRFAQMAGGDRPPSYLPILNARALDEQEILKRYQLESRKYYALMPASRWSSKEWGAKRYAGLAEEIKCERGMSLLLLGRESDRACIEVQDFLRARNIPYVAALRENDFSVTAVLLKHAISYVGSDTGLAHLSEAVGSKSAVIFGPTRPELGFGPFRKESLSVHANVWCSPCSKDGRICYRLTDRYACLNRITVEQVKQELFR